MKSSFTRIWACALFGLFLLLAAGTSLHAAKREYPPVFEGVSTEVYKTVGDVNLPLYIFEPSGGPKSNRPAIVFFFGGGWSGGTPAQFENQCRHLAARGMVAITADYRVASRHDVNPTHCVADAKSAIRWVRANAQRLGIDPQRIAAGGGSAGGHLAAATATISQFEEAGEKLEISSVPNAVVLFNPAVVLAPLEGLVLEGFTRDVPDRKWGADPRELSPAHHVVAGTPPTIIFHGRNDSTVPYATAEAFQRAMQAKGNRCDLVGYEGQGHGFFNFGNEKGRYEETVAAMDEFLVSIGWLPERPGGSISGR